MSLGADLDDVWEAGWLLSGTESITQSTETPLAHEQLLRSNSAPLAAVMTPAHEMQGSVFQLGKNRNLGATARYNSKNYGITPNLEHMRGNNFVRNPIQFVWWSQILPLKYSPILLLLVFFFAGAPQMRNSFSAGAREVSYSKLHILSRRCVKESRVQPRIRYSTVQNIT